MRRNILGDTPVNVPSGTFTLARRCALDPLPREAGSPDSSEERLYYVAPPHPRARALGWRLYVKESELIRLQRKYR